MYTISVPFNDYKKAARRESVSFNLDGREVFKMLPELKEVFDWMESNQKAEPRELSVEEIRNFYNSFEGILLEAYGEMSDDGAHFRKGGKFEFEESALFNACMIMFVTKPEETVKLLEGIMPMELFNMLAKAEAGEVSTDTSEKDAEIERLRAQIRAESSGTDPS